MLPGSQSKMQKDLMAELQNQWQCEIHSKEGKDEWCYTEPPATVCYALSIPDLGTWATEIVSASQPYSTIGRVQYLIRWATMQCMKRSQLH